MRCEGKFVFLAFAFLVLTAFASVSAAKTIYVPDDYAKIQWAVDSASIGDTIIVRDGTYYENVVVNKKLTIKSENGSAYCIVDGSSSDVFTLKADGIRIEGFSITGGGDGIDIRSNNNIISNSTISSNNDCGIYLMDSNNNTISNNLISSNNDYSIYLYESNNNIISNNLISNNDYGIDLEGNINSIFNNIISNNGGGMVLRGNNNSISNNIISNNNGGTYFYGNNNIISNNLISSNTYEGGIELWGNNNSILNNNINSNYWYGIYLGYSNNNSISENNISSNGYGIYLRYSNNNSISNNNISNGYGIYLYESNNNIIYLNNFINSICNAYSYDSTNIWNSTEPITYTYRGSEFKNYMGNYWDDYNGSDANGDGIGDTPYSIDSDKDNYPLIEGFENYFVPTPTPAQTFDTGRPENPYPSISGKFIGTIKTNKTIIATKLYTYACEGTGGHTEYALICNKTWCAYAEWDGYKEDWMNISFNKTVILMPYETYNITIVTGSYPQIHHTPSLKTENGWINCTEFTDANGKKYNDWIPAIMLWS
ncbi:MAG: right-handed parallel beta-helix repeat-containing protein [Candidatus Methanospirare jalkutatii]|nr:right-handed parallel beta-helix repeat-containing protein [Candidatus Methanospirare jalkutatii]